jgi:hypothetical protein
MAKDTVAGYPDGGAVSRRIVAAVQRVRRQYASKNRAIASSSQATQDLFWKIK